MQIGAHQHTVVSGLVPHLDGVAPLVLLGPLRRQGVGLWLGHRVILNKPFDGDFLALWIGEDQGSFLREGPLGRGSDSMDGECIRVHLWVAETV